MMVSPRNYPTFLMWQLCLGTRLLHNSLALKTTSSKELTTSQKNTKTEEL